MKKFCVVMFVFAIIGFCAGGASAVTIGLYEYAFNIDGTTTNGGLAGVDGAAFNFTTGLGKLTWTTIAVGSHKFIGYFDHEIDEAENTYFNEYGDLVNTAAVDQSWEIDEPGYVSGDIYANVVAGTLDNTNGVPSSAPDDVSWALGWDFALSADQKAIIELFISETAPASGFYLTQTDPDSNTTIYFWSTATIQDTGNGQLPEPATLLLLAAGCTGLLGWRRSKFSE